MPKKIIIFIPKRINFLISSERRFPPLLTLQVSHPVNAKKWKNDSGFLFVETGLRPVSLIIRSFLRKQESTKLVLGFEKMTTPSKRA